MKKVKLSKLNLNLSTVSTLEQVTGGRELSAVGVCIETKPFSDQKTCIWHSELMSACNKTCGCETNNPSC